MFTDARSKSVVFVTQCILNQNSISDGTADYPGCINEVVELLISSGIGIVQLPCPELHCLGLDRGNVKGAASPVVVENTRIRKELNKDSSAEKIKQLVSQVIYQIEEYLKYGFDVKGIIGINRSPSCGIETTSDNNNEVEGYGVFIEALHGELKTKNINIGFAGIKTSELEKARIVVKKLLGVN